jgi:hypothetical protein
VPQICYYPRYKIRQLLDIKQGGNGALRLFNFELHIEEAVMRTALGNNKEWQATHIPIYKIYGLNLLLF